MANKAQEDGISVLGVNAPQQTLATLEFKYTKKELQSFLEWRTAGLAHKSSVWLIKASEVLWKHTKGTISKASLDQLRAFLFQKYDDYYAQSKVLNFTKGFLKYQAKLTFDPRYLAFDMFLEKPRVRKTKKKMTARVVSKGDIEHVLSVIRDDAITGSIDEERDQQYTGIVFFGAFTGQRPYSTIAQLRVEQLRDALKHEKSVLHVEPAEDKIRMEHYVPLHPQLVGVIAAMCDGRKNSERMFKEESFRKWLQKRKIPLSKCNSHFVASDLRKFAKQHGDIGVDWRFYKGAGLSQHMISTCDTGEIRVCTIRNRRLVVRKTHRVTERLEPRN